MMDIMKENTENTDSAKTPPEHGPHEDLRSPLAIGLAWSSTISGIALQAILPGLAGLWLDTKLGTVLLFFFLGLVLGMASAMMQLLKIVRKK